MKFVYRLLIYIPLFIISCYAFTFIHELGHAVAIILTGNEVKAIEVYINFGGKCPLIWHNYDDAGIIYIAGSLAVISVCILPFIYSFCKKNLWIFFITFTHIVGQLAYWATSPFLDGGDAYLTIYWAEFYGYNGIIDIVYSLTTYLWVVIVLMYILYSYLMIRVFKNLVEKRDNVFYGR